MPSPTRAKNERNCLFFDHPEPKVRPNRLWNDKNGFRSRGQKENMNVQVVYDNYTEIIEVVKNMEVSHRYQREVANQLMNELTLRNSDGELTTEAGEDTYEALRRLAALYPRIATPTSLCRAQHTVRRVQTFEDLRSDPEHSEGLLRQAFIRAHGSLAFEKLLRSRAQKAAR